MPDGTHLLIRGRAQSCAGPLVGMGTALLSGLPGNQGVCLEDALLQLIAGNTAVPLLVSGADSQTGDKRSD